MKIICEKEKLKNGLEIVSGIIGDAFKMYPILNNVCLDVKDKELYLTTSNIEMQVSYNIPLVKVEKEGSITLPAKLLLSYLLNTSSKLIELSELDGKKIRIKTETGSAKIFGMDQKEFDKINKLDNIDPLFEIDPEVLKYSFIQEIPITSFSESRPEISGIFLNAKKNKIILTATDSFRLAEKKINIVSNKETSLIIPRRTAEEVGRIINTLESKKNLKVIVNGNNLIQFNIGKCSIISKLINGSYPAYESIIPKDFKNNIIINRLELINAIKSIGLFDTKTNKAILRLDADTQEIKLEAESETIGKGKVIIKGKNILKTEKVILNYKYVLDGINLMFTDNIEMKFNEISNPILFSQVGNVDYLYLIMPIKQD